MINMELLAIVMNATLHLLVKAASEKQKLMEVVNMERLGRSLVAGRGWEMQAHTILADKA